jgi:hypothetical protein
MTPKALGFFSFGGEWGRKLGFFFVVLNVFPIMFPIAPHFISYCFVISSTLVTYISMIFFIFPLFISKSHRVTNVFPKGVPDEELIMTCSITCESLNP